MANERPPRKGAMKQTGTFFEYRVPKDYHAGMDERVAELVEKGYKVKTVTSKGTILQIDKDQRDKWEKEKIAHFEKERIAAVNKDLEKRVKVQEGDVGEISGPSDDDLDNDVDG